MGFVFVSTRCDKAYFLVYDQVILLAVNGSLTVIPRRLYRTTALTDTRECVIVMRRVVRRVNIR